MFYRPSRSFRRNRRYSLVRKRNNYYYNHNYYDNYYSRRRRPYKKRFNRRRKRNYWFKKRCQKCDRKEIKDRDMELLDKQLENMTLKDRR